MPDDPATGRRTTEIEITPAMIEAGEDILADLTIWGGDNGGFFDRNTPLEIAEVVRRVFLAMAAADRRPLPA
jgi:hypothetical protein